MTSGVLIQVFFDLILLAAIAFLWVKLHRPQKDDPRLSRGLQLLQSKIAVLEDLSDQVETQVQQITALMEAKGKEIQAQLLFSDKQIQKIEASMEKSKEVAKIFQDRIPHQEIIERQNTIKYVKAARLAHQGASMEEIVEQVDLARGEIELIAKVNRNQLQFSEDDLPEWAKEQSEESAAMAPVVPDTPKVEAPAAAPVSLSTIGEKFRQALPQQEAAPTSTAKTGPAIEMPGKAAAPPTTPVKKEITQTTSGKTVEIQKVVFPRLDLTQHLS